MLGERRIAAARRVRDLLRTGIVSGTYHDVMPSEMDLIHQFGASRNAVRVALDLLRCEGLVERVQGTGTHIISHRARHRSDRLVGLKTGMGGGGRVHHEPMVLRQVPAPPLVHEVLQIAAGAPVVLYERRTILDGEPLALWTSYLPYDLAASMLEPGCDPTGDWYEVVEHELGQPVARASMESEAVVADASVAELLGTVVGGPLLLLHRKLILADGRVASFGIGRSRGDRVSLLTWRYREEAVAIAHRASA